MIIRCETEERSVVVRRSESVEACAELNESPWMWICDTMPESGLQRCCAV